jgi:hypothetical protein
MVQIHSPRPLHFFFLCAGLVQLRSSGKTSSVIMFTAHGSTWIMSFNEQPRTPTFQPIQPNTDQNQGFPTGDSAVLM